LWVQTSNESFVCLLGSATYTVEYEFQDGLQSSVQKMTADFEPLWAPANPKLTTASGIFGNRTDMVYSYMAVFTALTKMLTGNWTTTCSIAEGNMNSGIFQTGLIACDDFEQSWWNSHCLLPAKSVNETNVIYLEGPAALCGSANVALQYQDQNSSCNATNTVNQGFYTLDEKPSYYCRRRSLMRAIEDLAQNVTLNMLTLPELT